MACFLATQVVFFLLLFGCMLDTNHQRSVSEQSRTSFQEWKQASFHSTNRKSWEIFFPPQRMEKQYFVGKYGTTNLAQCMFCGSCNFDDIWEHYKRCKRKKDTRKCTKARLLLQKRIGGNSWNESSNHIPFGNDGKTSFVHIAGIPAKTYTTRSFVRLHLYVGGTPTKRLPFGMEARNWFVERETYSIVGCNLQNHKGPGEVRCTLSREDANTTSIGILLQIYSNTNVGRKMSFHPKKASLSKLYEKQLEKEKERERETPPPLSLQSIRECFEEDCSRCRKKRKDKM